MLGNRHAFTCPISCPSPCVSTAATLRLIRTLAGALPRISCIFKGMEGAVSLKRHFQLILTGAIPVNLKQRPLSKKKNTKKQKNTTTNKTTKKLNLFIEIPKATFYLFYIFIYYIEFIFNEICTGQIGILEALGSVSIKWQSLLPTCGKFMQVNITLHGHEKF